MVEKISILGSAGSLRKNSCNKALLRVAEELMPENVRLEILDLEGIPPFNQDFQDQPPQKVREFKAKIKAADAILIATPEYNYSMLGVLKNAIDWASRPPTDNAWEGKPVAIMGASTGRLGTARAQYHLRQCFVVLDMYPLNYPEVMVPYAQQSFGENGKFKDQKARELIAELLRNLVEWTKLKQN